MVAVSVDALLPVLVAELADDEARTLVADLAAAGKVCLVPLLDPPVDASMHVLEVNTPGQNKPLVVLAEPAGAPTERGFPLRLHAYGTAPAKSIAPPPKTDALPSVKSSIRRPQTITKLHTQDLLGE